MIIPRILQNTRANAIGLLSFTRVNSSSEIHSKIMVINGWPQSAAEQK